MIDGYNKTQDKNGNLREDNGLKISTEGYGLHTQKQIITDEAIVVPDMKPRMVGTFMIPSYSKSSNFHVYYNAIALLQIVNYLHYYPTEAIL